MPHGPETVVDAGLVVARTRALALTGAAVFTSLVPIVGIDARQVPVHPLNRNVARSAMTLVPGLVYERSTSRPVAGADPMDVHLLRVDLEQFRVVPALDARSAAFDGPERRRSDALLIVAR